MASPTPMLGLDMDVGDVPTVTGFTSGTPVLEGIKFYSPFYMTQSGRAPDGIDLIVADPSGGSTVAVVLGAPPVPNRPVYVVVAAAGGNVTVNGISPSTANKSNGGETISFLSDGDGNWYVLGIAAEPITG